MTAQIPCTKATIIYTSRLRWDLGCKLLKHLINKGMLELSLNSEKKGGLYMTSPKGDIFLTSLLTLQKSLNIQIERR